MQMSELPYAQRIRGTTRDRDRRCTAPCEARAVPRLLRSLVLQNHRLWRPAASCAAKLNGLWRELICQDGPAVRRHSIREQQYKHSPVSLRLSIFSTNSTPTLWPRSRFSWGSKGGLVPFVGCDNRHSLDNSSNNSYVTFAAPCKAETAVKRFSFATTAFLRSGLTPPAI